MAIRGRKPTPTHLALVQGRPSHKLPDPSTEIRAPLDEPTPPDHLSDEAMVEWGRVVGAAVNVPSTSTLSISKPR